MTVNGRSVLFSALAEAQALDDLVTAALRLGSLDIGVLRSAAPGGLAVTYQLVGANTTRVGPSRAPCMPCGPALAAAVRALPGSGQRGRQAGPPGQGAGA
jgi:hypothetical protein